MEALVGAVEECMGRTVTLRTRVAPALSSTPAGAWGGLVSPGEWGDDLAAGRSMDRFAPAPAPPPAFAPAFLVRIYGLNQQGGEGTYQAGGR